MIAPLAKLMDWSSIQAAVLMMPAHDLNSKLEEAIQFLNGPDFIPAESQPAQVLPGRGKSPDLPIRFRLRRGGSYPDGGATRTGQYAPDLHFTFPTPRPCEFAENNVVHGRLYRCAGRWQERPVIILLPGWNDSASYKLRFPLIARRGNRAGFNVATLVPPYHFQRCPRQRSEFDRGDCLQFAEGAAQGIAEIRALTGWLLAEGCPAVALWGYSAGAWFAGMAACHDARLSSVILASHPGRTSAGLEQWAVRPRIRANLGRVREVCEALNRTPMNLTTTRPVIPRENILLIQGLHDLICSKEDIEHLWQAWGKPDIWRLPHGHCAICCGFVPGLPQRILDWLSPRLNHSAMTREKS
jgi:pimeloyl-ACP methyl ester carboxylesterase